MPTKPKAPRQHAAPEIVAHRTNGLTPQHPGRERVTEIQRARILAAMVELSGEHGPVNVTVGHVVERAGISRRTFYALYRDREACLLGALDDGLARVSRHVAETYDPDAKWIERIRLGLTGLLSFLDAEPGMGRLLIVGSLGAGAPALERRRAMLAQMIALVDEGRLEAKDGATLPPLTGEGIVGGVMSVLHARLLDDDRDSVSSLSFDGTEGGLLALTGSLMSMIVLPYLGPAAARRELARPVPRRSEPATVVPADPLRDMGMRLTYRTVRVLGAIAANPGASNREVGLVADMQDQGQISKLLTRLAKLGLIENGPAGLARGAPNAWLLTVKGHEIEQAIGQGAAA